MGATDSNEERETLDFVGELSRDLTPVERIVRLRTAALRVVGLWLAVTAALAVAKGLTEQLSDPARMLGGFGAVLGGLSLVGVGGVVAALAAAIPGREGVVRTGSTLLVFGFLVALGLGGVLLQSDAMAGKAPSLQSDVACLVLAVTVAVLPALGALAYVVRAAPARPVATLWAIGVGCVGLGAFTAQLGCSDGALRHLLMSHALAPGIGSLLFLAPLWFGFQRFRRV